MYQPITINGRVINDNSPAFFIADIASNHDSDKQRAIDLIHLAAEAGADAVKFQHFLADEIVSDEGFQKVGKQSHQSDWPLSVYETYKKYELNREWTATLAEEAKKAGVAFMSTPYDLEAVGHLDPFVPAWKVGSGDFDYFPLLHALLETGKPIIFATGATAQWEIEARMQGIRIQEARQPIALMQCNTSYTGSLENFKYINLRVINWMRATFPGMTIGLSDHTPGHATVLGAVTLGARLIEKHFTDDNSRIGPDHAFSMNPTTWRDMIDRTRELQAALGGGVKRVEENEKETRILQRRGKWVVNGQEKWLRPAL
jgi:N-acetylneuraminate synthase